MTELKNIGTKTLDWLNQVGVYTLEDVEELGVLEVYRRLKHAFPDKVTLNALWGLQGAVLGISHTQLPQAMKDDLLANLAAMTDED
jgi:DNA transformation protein and related proteins